MFIMFENKMRNNNVNRAAEQRIIESAESISNKLFTFN